MNKLRIKIILENDEKIYTEDFEELVNNYIKETKNKVIDVDVLMPIGYYCAIIKEEVN